MKTNGERAGRGQPFQTREDMQIRGLGHRHSRGDMRRHPRRMRGGARSLDLRSRDDCVPDGPPRDAHGHRSGDHHGGRLPSRLHHAPQDLRDGLPRRSPVQPRQREKHQDHRPHMRGRVPSLARGPGGDDHRPRPGDLPVRVPVPDADTGRLRLHLLPAHRIRHRPADGIGRVPAIPCP